MTAEGPAKEVVDILRQWEEEHASPNYDPIPTLTKLAVMIEIEAENYQKMDPDPFDERHPSRVYPNCALGHMLKVLFRKDIFMTKLVMDYLRENYYSRQNIIGKDVRKLNIAACRLMLDIMPGLETSAVFETPTNDALIQRLFSWATDAPEPLQTYATGLLAAAMEVQDIAAGFREDNNRLVPLMLERLHKLQREEMEERTKDYQQNCATNPRPFAHLNSHSKDNTLDSSPRKKMRTTRNNKPQTISLYDTDACMQDTFAKTVPKTNGISQKDCKGGRRSSCELGRMSPPRSKASPCRFNESSNSSWSEMEPFLIGSVQMYPPTLDTRQMFILKYLTPMGEYQEFLSHVFEKNALGLILNFINIKETKRSSRLAFEALKYLAALLCHKKFSIEFLSMNGLQHLLEVPQPGIAATGVSICFYYLAYCEDAMERVCLLPKEILHEVVRYGLWLLECSHDSGRCHATMFFGLSFQFQIILEEFDSQDGLRILYNVMSMLQLLSNEGDTVNEDEESSARQIVRHVCVALKRYLEAHLFIQVHKLQRAETGLPSNKICKSSPEEVLEQIETMMELFSFRDTWDPVNKLFNFGGITLLLRVIIFAYEWNYSGRAETVRSALDVLNICSIMPCVALQLCQRVDLPDDANTVGLNVILGAAEGEIVADPEVQKAALGVIITCVCAPIHRFGSKISSSSNLRKRSSYTINSKGLLEKIWECVRTNNGIMVLLSLMTVKTPITDADYIRCLACRALVGLARSETVRQILSMLPLFTNGELQRLMRDPILQDKRQEHVKFQKYALELLEQVSGKTKPDGSELEASLSYIHRANVIAQTRIQFNDKQLFQLIHQHLLSHGMKDSAAMLQKEAGLPEFKNNSNNPFLSPFTYATHSNQCRPRCLSGNSPLSHPLLRLNTSSHQQSDLASPSNSPLGAGFSVRGAATPVCTIKAKPQKLTVVTSQASKTLQKQTESDRLCTALASQASKTLQKQTVTDRVIAAASPVPLQSQPQSQRLTPEPHVTLESIVTEYLTNQHALCKNPMVTCPQFNLLVPHKCPDPKPRNLIPGNFTMRYCKGLQSRRLDQRLIHSRFCPVRTFRLSEDDGYFTCCEFLSDKYLMVGTYGGEVKMFNLQTGADDLTYACHEGYISNLECNKAGNLLLSSTTWRRPLSAMWSVDKVFEQKYAFYEEEFIEFSKLVQDKVIGTKSDIATIYDIETGKKLCSLKPTMSNQYNKNRATFSPTDELVLSDGVLWDVNSGKEIHKLDKLNQTLSGVFHPNGLEIISNTEVWDLRTFHLLRTVSTLDQCSVIFPPTAAAIYAVSLEKENEEESVFETSFKTLDPYDYSSIITVDVKKNIYHLACNMYDTSIAIVENLGDCENVDESTVRLYDVGRYRDDDDEGDEEEEEEEDMENSDGSGSDDDQQDDAVSFSIIDGGSGSEISDDGGEDDNELESDADGEADADGSSNDDDDDSEMEDLGS
nr:PREDICTED: protein mahjong isoform X2 [Bemisia tabaci]